MPSAGRLPCAARPWVTTSTHEKPLWVIATAMPVGSGITASSATHRFAEHLGAQACVLLVGDRGDDHPSGSVTRALQPPRRRRPPSPPGRPSCPARRGRRGVRRAGSAKTARVMPSTPTVSVWPHSIRVGPGAAPSATATTLGRPGATSSHVDVEARPPQIVASQSAIAASPAAPGTSDGFTESMATSSRVSASGSIARIAWITRRSIRRLRRCADHAAGARRVAAAVGRRRAALAASSDAFKQRNL